MHVFYQPGIKEGIHYLDENESRHCAKVLRLKGGDAIELTDGKGSWYYATLENVKSKNVTFHVNKCVSDAKEQIPYIHLAVALTKNADRYEWFVEKAVEIGVSEITPLICKHSERVKIRGDRLNKIAISAIKQSKKAFLPIINEQTDFNKLVELSQEQAKFIAYCEEKNELLRSDSVNNRKSVIMLIGPEGDFSVEEIQLARQKGFLPVSLGESRLRTETAAIVSCCILNFT